MENVNIEDEGYIIKQLIYCLQSIEGVKKKIRLFLRILGEKEEERHEIRQQFY